MQPYREFMRERVNAKFTPPAGKECFRHDGLQNKPVDMKSSCQPGLGTLIAHVIFQVKNQVRPGKELQKSGAYIYVLVRENILPAVLGVKRISTRQKLPKELLFVFCQGIIACNILNPAKSGAKHIPVDPEEQRGKFLLYARGLLDMVIAGVIIFCQRKPGVIGDDFCVKISNEVSRSRKSPGNTDGKERLVIVQLLLNPVVTVARIICEHDKRSILLQLMIQVPAGRNTDQAKTGITRVEPGINHPVVGFQPVSLPVLVLIICRTFSVKEFPKEKVFFPNSRVLAPPK